MSTRCSTSHLIGYKYKQPTEAERGAHTDKRRRKVAHYFIRASESDAHAEQPPPPPPTTRRRMATPLADEGSIAAAVMPRSPSPPAAAAGSAAEAPMLIFLYFHKAIRAELEGLHAAAVRLATERAGDVGALAERCRFFVNIYKHHCDAEDAVRTG